MWGFTYFVHIINPFDYRQISNWAIFLSILPILAIYVGERVAYPKNTSQKMIPFLIPNRTIKLLLLFLSIFVFLSATMLFISAYTIYGEFWSSGGGASLKSDRVALGSAALSGTKYGFIAKYFVVLQGLAQVTMIMGLFYNYFQKKYSIPVIVLPLLAIVMMSVSFGSRAQIGGLFWVYILFYIINYKGSFIKLIKIKIYLMKKILKG